MVWINELPWGEMRCKELECQSEDELCRGVEGNLRSTLYLWRHMPADMVVDGLYTVSLSGQDLTRMGYAPGPSYTEIFQELLRAKLDGELHSHQEEIEYVRGKFAGTAQPLRV